MDFERPARAVLRVGDMPGDHVVRSVGFFGIDLLVPMTIPSSPRRHLVLLYDS